MTVPDRTSYEHMLPVFEAVALKAAVVGGGETGPAGLSAAVPLPLAEIDELMGWLEERGLATRHESSTRVVYRVPGADEIKGSSPAICAGCKRTLGSYEDGGEWLLCTSCAESSIAGFLHAGGLALPYAAAVPETAARRVRMLEEHAVVFAHWQTVRAGVEAPTVAQLALYTSLDAQAIEELLEGLVYPGYAEARLDEELGAIRYGFVGPPFTERDYQLLTRLAQGGGVIHGGARHNIRVTGRGDRRRRSERSRAEGRDRPRRSARIRVRESTRDQVRISVKPKRTDEEEE